MCTIHVSLCIVVCLKKTRTNNYAIHTVNTTVLTPSSYVVDIIHMVNVIDSYSVKLDRHLSWSNIVINNRCVYYTCNTILAVLAAVLPLHRNLVLSRVH